VVNDEFVMQLRACLPRALALLHDGMRYWSHCSVTRHNGKAMWGQAAAKKWAVRFLFGRSSLASS